MVERMAIAKKMSPAFRWPSRKVYMDSDGSTGVSVLPATRQWMKGAIMVFDHPFFAVTGEDGSFEITGVPAGAQKLIVSQFKVGYVTPNLAAGLPVLRRVEGLLERVMFHPEQGVRKALLGLARGLGAVTDVAGVARVLTRGLVAEIPLRYLIAFVFPITATMRSFLEAKGHARDDVDAMHAAWFKAVVLHVCLWSQAYAPESW